MWVALAILAAVLLSIVVYLSKLDGRLQVRRSLEIDATPETVFGAIVDFKSWPEWSPWLMHEADAKVVFSDDYQQEGGSYNWDGKLIGAGKLSHVTIKPHSRIDQKIEFMRPFRSVSQVCWELDERDGKTGVSWEMNGRMPFLFRFMARRMQPVIERDYDLGLALLNGYLNHSAPHPSIRFIGPVELEDFNYWAIPCNGNLRQIEKARQQAIETLTAAAAGKTGLALTLYHQFDPLAAQYRAEIAIPVTDKMPLSNYTRRQFSGGRYYQMTLRGDHRFLPLGWHALSCHCRMHRVRLDLARPALEIYHDNPEESSDSNQITTALYIPTR